MKLPVNCFKTITDYVKNNWISDLAPAEERTWSQWRGIDGYKNIVKEEFGNTTRFSWEEGTPTTDWTYWLAVSMYAYTDDYKGYVPVFHGKFLNYAAMTKSGWNPKDNSLKMAMDPGATGGIYLDAILIDYINLDAYWIPNQAMLELCKAQKGKKVSWFAVGDSKVINSSMFKYFEITMVPMERINEAPRRVIPFTIMEPLKAGDSGQGYLNRFYISPTAPLDTELATFHVAGYSDVKLRWNGTKFYYLLDGTEVFITAADKDDFGNYMYFVSARFCTEIIVEGALVRPINKEN